jgi:hypothetical protein
MVHSKGGGVVSIQTINQAIEPDIRFSLQIREILWTLGMCAASLSLTPFVAFYALLVA